MFSVFSQLNIKHLQKMPTKLFASIALILLIWGIYIVDWILPIAFTQFGIVPRSITGLFGIPFAPFLHAGLLHISSNTLPLFFLTWTLLVFYEKISIPVWTLSALLGGLLVWIFARGNAVHVGASGVIFSLIGFLIASGIFQRNFKSILISIIVVFVYGGVLWGMLPTKPWVSWEGHLFGFIAGVFLAWVYRKKAKK